MPESKRLESRSTAAAEKDSRAEALLVDGLERYFAGRYEDAIHLWTRVLFLDRAHPRARAYIDRGRTALAERQRRTEEMLQTTGDLLASGQTAAARDLLREAVAAGGDDDRAAALGLQLERLERMPGAAPRPAVVDAVPMPAPRARWSAAATALSIGVVLIAVLSAGASVRTWMRVERDAQDLPSVSPTMKPAVPSNDEVALLRARTLYAHGRLAEALAALDRVQGDAPNQAAADNLRVDIQRLLLASSRPMPPTAAAASTPR
jgi:tetratricopeptide (TPR) repeat protein